MRSIFVVVAMCALMLPRWSAAQNPADVERLMQDSGVKAALDATRTGEDQVIADQVRFCEIPAPEFNETARGVVVKQAFEQLGLTNVRVDRVGNVLGDRAGRAAKPKLVIAGHLDTVFPEGTDVHVTRDGSVLKAPGIGDDCRGLAVLMGIIRALNAAKVQTQGTITFVADVGEEGLGDLRGMKALFDETLKGQIDRFVSIDGSGIGVTRVAVGSHRYRMTFKGPGGHSFGAFGLANPIHAMGRAIAMIAEVQVPSNPKTTFNVGRVGGGTSVNSIPFEGWFEVDMRSSDKASLAAVDAKVQAAVDSAVVQENRRWNHPGMITVEKKLVGDRPAGNTPADAPIVRTALAVAGALGKTVTPGEGSTDSNYPMSLGLPAITIGGGGRGYDAHALTERFDTTDSWLGTQWVTLLAIALSQPGGAAVP
jgi:acetylornithine deacetylase/succinyl-diaminopimelate desuccinylase-like protein